LATLFPGSIDPNHFAGEHKAPRQMQGLKEQRIAPNLAWLSEVEEAGGPEKQDCRIWIKSGCLRAGRSTIPHPHRHSFCEISLQIHGVGVLYAGAESLERRAGDLLLMGAQVPHWYEIKSYPLEYITIYFFPTALVNWVAPGVSTQLLRRFTAMQPLKQRNLHLSSSLRSEFTQSFRSAAAEFEARRFGWELSLHASLAQVLIALARWERRSGHVPASNSFPVNWERLDRALQFLRQHHAEPVYGRDLARQVGMSESSFNAMFRDALGLSWVKYLQGLRVQSALALLAQPGRTISSVAFATGFDSLSHFNTTFRSLMGMSPKDVLRKQEEIS
jgi:AraC-like DNA-binding protein